MTSGQVSSSRKRLKNFMTWLVSALGGFLTGFGLFAAFLLEGIEEMIDKAWIKKYLTDLPMIERPHSSYYAVLTIKYVGFALFFLGIIVFVIAGYLAYSSREES